jgi:cytochrome bd-type quinol oxidase subunit 2
MKDSQWFFWLLMSGIALWSGNRIFLRPREHKDELTPSGHLFAEWPIWMVRALGVFVTAVGLVCFYLFLRFLKFAF